MKYTYASVIVITVLIMFYQNTEPFIIFKELLNNILIHNHNVNNNVETFEIVYQKIYTTININTYNTQSINTEYITIDKKIHDTTKNSVIVIMLSIGIYLSLQFTYQLFMYTHETKKTNNILILAVNAFIIAFIYLIELTTNTILKKKLSNTEIIYDTAIQINTFIYFAIVITIIYNILSYYINNKANTNRKGINSKITIILLLEAIGITVTQYSIYEITTIIIYAEVISQCVTLYKIYIEK